MKKFICLFIAALIVLFIFAGCKTKTPGASSSAGVGASSPAGTDSAPGPELSAPEESASPQSESEPDQSMSSKTENSAGTSEPESHNQTFTFKVNADMPEYTCEVLIKGEGRFIDGLTITDKKTGTLVQTLTVSDLNNSVITQSAAYFMDVTFDGNIDILVPCAITKNLWIAAYLWDAESKRFVYNQKFEEMGNIVVDPDNKKILTKNYLGLGQSTFYSVLSFNGIDFVLEKQISFVPSEDLTTTFFRKPKANTAARRPLRKLSFRIIIIQTPINPMNGWPLTMRPVLTGT